MAIYIRSRPTTGIRVFGYLSALATVGVAIVYPAVLFLAAWGLGSMDEAMAYQEEEKKGQVANAAAHIVAITTIYSAVLTALCFGAVFCFRGTDRWLPKDATAAHCDIVSARFLHVARDPNRRAMGLLWAMLAGMLLVASPIILMAVPHPLIYSESTQKLVGQATAALLLLHTALFIVLVRTAVHRRSSMVRLSQHGIAIANLELFNLALPSGRDNFRIQEAPARRGRVHLQAVYAPPKEGARLTAPAVIPRLSLTVKPSQLDDARSQVETWLDEVWRASELVRTPPEQNKAVAPVRKEPVQ
ncbi:hypothetical protein FK256_08140 [Actinomyces johnsonii]|uniref:Uncharacterized protein n=1 Tax=Actinomyces johnsonii TaxID=544581 RepID=A0A508A132_9ACTO|nr:hypothetical protein [Actinomyces johnsonii]KAA8736125.1 hypothetical protein F4W10_12880 [Actinomyces johnsonii]TQD42997.1 hypothetical protein FK256_08140 [Actinomyces johnsonii]